MPDADEQPVTFRLVTVVVACVLTVMPVVAWAAKLQSEVNSQADEVTQMRKRGTEATHRLEPRIAVLEKSEALRGAQLDRIETKLDRLLEIERTR